MPDESLITLEHLVRDARNRSMQLSYGRRAPAPDARRLLERARRELFTRLQENPHEAASLRLLSQVEEMLLNYRGALAYLEQALALSSTRDRRALKKLAQLRAAVAEWSTLGLTPTELHSLGEYLRSKLAEAPSERSRKWTTEWLHEHCPERKTQVLGALDDRGAYSDHQVLMNVAKG